MSKWNAWEDGPSRTPPDGARMSGPMADWADEEADDLVSGARDGSIGRAETAAALRKARREGMEAAKTVIADLDTELETLRAREGEMRKALQNARHAIAARWAPSISELLMEIDRALLTPASPGEGK